MIDPARNERQRRADIKVRPDKELRTRLLGRGGAIKEGRARGEYRPAIGVSYHGELAQCDDRVEEGVFFG